MYVFLRVDYKAVCNLANLLADPVLVSVYTARMGRMPESRKARLKTMLAAEVEAMLTKRSDMSVVKIADGAKDN